MRKCFREKNGRHAAGFGDDRGEVYQITGDVTDWVWNDGSVWLDNGDFYDYKTNTFMALSIGNLFLLTTVTDWTETSASIYKLTDTDGALLMLGDSSTWDYGVKNCLIEIHEDKVIITGTKSKAILVDGAFDDWDDDYETDFIITITFDDADEIEWPLIP